MRRLYYAITINYAVYATLRVLVDKCVCLSEAVVIYTMAHGNANTGTYPNPRLAHATVALTFVKPSLHAVPHRPK